MNMLIGVLCEVISSVAQREKEKLASAFWADKVHKVLDGMRTNSGGLISRREFSALLHNPEAIQSLRDVDVEPLALVDMADMLFQSDSNGQEFENTLDFNTFMHKVMQLRESNVATVRDVNVLKQFILHQNSDRNLVLRRMEEIMWNAIAQRTRIEERLDLLSQSVQDLQVPSKI